MPKTPPHPLAQWIQSQWPAASAETHHRVLSLIAPTHYQTVPQLKQPPSPLPWQEQAQFVLEHAPPQEMASWLSAWPEHESDAWGRFYEQGLMAQNRKNQGQFHTPPHLIQALLAHWQESLSGNTTQVQTILDPACGTGAFLLGMARQAESNQQDLPGHHYLGCDVDPVSVYLAEQIFRHRQATHPQERFSGICGDVLHGWPYLLGKPLPDSLSEGENAFWQTLQQGVDWVVGNPPYVGEKHHQHLFQSLLKSVPQWQTHYRGRMDYWYFFLHLGLRCLKPGGHLLFLTSRYWLTADSAQNLREDILKQGHLLELIDFEDTGLFNDAKGHHNTAFLIQKKATAPSPIEVAHCPLWTTWHIDRTNHTTLLAQPQSTWTSAAWHPPAGDMWEDLWRQVLSHSQPLSNIFWEMQGVISGADTLTQRHLRQFPELAAAVHRGQVRLGQGIFCLQPPEWQALSASLTSSEAEIFLKPFYKGVDVAQASENPIYCQLNIPPEQAPRLLYVPHHLDGLPPQAILAYLQPFQPILEARREVHQGKIPWYALHWPRNAQRLQAVSIVTPRRATRHTFALAPEGWFENSDLTVLGLKSFLNAEETLNERETLYPPWIALLNSPLLNAWSHFRGKQKGTIREFYATPLRALPLPLNQEAIPSLNSSRGDLKAFHQAVCGLYALNYTQTQHVWDWWQQFDAKTLAKRSDFAIR